MTDTNFRVSVLEMRIPPVAFSVFVASAVVGFASTVNAQCTTAASPEGAPIATELVAEAHRARTWRYAWTGINAGSMVLSLGGIPILPKSETPALAVGAAASALSGLFTWFWPLDVEEDARVAQQLGCRPQADIDRELLRLRDHSARDEASRVQWPWHVGNFATALIPGAILWFGFNRHLDGALTTVGSFATGEIELLTQPTGLTVEHRTNVHLGATGVMTRRGGVLAYTLVW